MASRGLCTAILDLTQGEAGTRGTADDRAREANEAARLLGVNWRQALDLTDGAVENTLENRIKIARVLRQLRPRVVILPYWQARHPDHAIVAALGYEACFLAGLAKAPAMRPTATPTQEDFASADLEAPPYRPFKIVYASLYADVRPSFIVDITPFIDQRHQALMAYRSQYANQTAGLPALSRKKRFASELLPRRGITACLPASATASHLYKRRSAWWTTLPSFQCSRSESLLRRAYPSHALIKIAYSKSKKNYFALCVLASDTGMGGIA